MKKQRRDQERMWRDHLDMLEKSRDAELGKPVDLGPAHMLALGAPNETGIVVSTKAFNSLQQQFPLSSLM